MRQTHSSVQDGTSAHIDGNGTATLETISRIDTESLLSPPRLSGNKFSQSGRPKLKIVVLGPPLGTRGNGEAAIYRGLLRELSVRSHDVLFLERGLQGRSPKPTYGRTGLYSDTKELKNEFATAIREADFVMVGSQVDEEILISHSSDETLVYLEEIPELDRRRMGYRARERVLAGHTTRHRAAELERYALQVLKTAAA